MSQNSHKPIGGFFELELPNVDEGEGYHKNAFALTTGRACIHTILKIEKPNLVYVPFYSCYALYEPMQRLGVKVIFYPINELLEPVSFPNLKVGEMYIYINYFGLKNKLCNDLAAKYGSRMIIDNTHNFFNYGYKDSYSFTSARKYFGVPDGAYLYGGRLNDIDRNDNISISHNIKRLEGFLESAYKDYLKAEARFDIAIKRISTISEKLLETVDYNLVVKKRIENYNFLHDALKKTNHFNFDLKINNDTVPFCYPYIPNKHIEKKSFHRINIFIPTLWPDILDRNENFNVSFEKNMVKKTLFLPIDHRYSIKEMMIIINLIEKLLD